MCRSIDVMVLFSWIQRSSGSTEKEAWCDAPLHGPPQERRRADRRGGSRGTPEGPSSPGQAWAKALKYWFNEEKGEVFCLVDAPSAEAADAVHKEAHGLGADEITEVKEGS